MLNFLASWRRGRESVRELDRLSDRELADIGIARADIRSVVERAAQAAADGPELASMAPSWGMHLRGSAAA